MENNLNTQDKSYLDQLSSTIKKLVELNTLSKIEQMKTIQNVMNNFDLLYENYLKTNKQLLQRLEPKNHQILHKALYKINEYISQKETSLTNYFDMYGEEYTGHKGCTELRENYDESLSLFASIKAFNALFDQEVDYLDYTHIERIAETMRKLREDHYFYSDGYCDAC